MTMHLQRDIEGLRKKLLMLGALVEESTSKAGSYLDTGQLHFADAVNTLENKINSMEVEIEEDCLKTLALHQPVAIDLRFIIVALKVNNDLERMGDQAVNIVARVASLQDEPQLTNQLALTKMNQLVQTMVRNSLDALVNSDVKLAHSVVLSDEVVDTIHASNYQVLRAYVKTRVEAVSTAMSYGTISSNIERIGDLATNIAEEVIFMIEGRVIRHQ